MFSLRVVRIWSRILYYHNYSTYGMYLKRTQVKRVTNLLKLVNSSTQRNKFNDFNHYLCLKNDINNVAKLIFSIYCTHVWINVQYIKN